MDFYQYLPAPPRASCWLDVVETLHSKIQMWWGYNPHIREVLGGTVLTVAEIHKYHVILPQTGKFDLRSKDLHCAKREDYITPAVQMQIQRPTSCQLLTNNYISTPMATKSVYFI